MPIHKKTKFLKILDFMRCKLQKDGLYADAHVQIRFPNVICIEWIFALAYYGVSLILLWVGSASFWTLLLNSLCLARAIAKTTRKRYCFSDQLQELAIQDGFDEETRNFLKYNSKVYLQTQLREVVCAVTIFVTLVALRGMSDLYVVLAVKVAASVALLGAAWDDFLCETEDIYNATPFRPSFAGK